MADDEVQAGAMIALVPTPDDAARLAVDGGEPVDDLHCTILYLGEAADIEPDERQAILDWAATMAKGWERVDANAFAPALFNPLGAEPCAVLVLSGEELAEFYETTLADVSDMVALPPDRHQPFVPHCTLIYIEDYDVRTLAERCGPVIFDRLRVAFAGENHDIAFGDTQPVDEVVDEEIAEPEPVAEVPEIASAAPEREPWDGCPRGFHPAHTGNCPPAL